MFIDLPNLESIILGYRSFSECNKIIIKSLCIMQMVSFLDLPNLQSIYLGECALYGESDTSSTLLLQGNLSLCIYK